MVFLLLWFLMQLFYGMATAGVGDAVGGVAWWAHIGGFVFGMIVAPILAVRRRPVSVLLF